MSTQRTTHKAGDRIVVPGYLIEAMADQIRRDHAGEDYAKGAIDRRVIESMLAAASAPGSKVTHNFLVEQHDFEFVGSQVDEQQARRMLDDYGQFMCEASFVSLPDSAAAA